MLQKSGRRGRALRPCFCERNERRKKRRKAAGENVFHAGVFSRGYPMQRRRTQASCTDRSKRARRQAGAASGQKGFFSDEEKTSRPGRDPGGMFSQKGGQSLSVGQGLARRRRTGVSAATLLRAGRLGCVCAWPSGEAWSPASGKAGREVLFSSCAWRLRLRLQTLRRRSLRPGSARRSAKPSPRRPQGRFWDIRP